MTLKPTPKVKRLLVVEDEAVIAAVCTRVLTDEGFEVHIASNGKIAQNLLTQWDYELAVIDIRTPAMDGEQLYDYISHNYPKLSRKVLFTSGDLMQKTTLDFVAETGRPFLRKPFTPAELRVMARAILQAYDKEIVKSGSSCAARAPLSSEISDSGSVERQSGGKPCDSMN